MSETTTSQSSIFSDTGVKVTFIYKSASRYEEVLFCFKRECYVLSDIK